MFDTYCNGSHAHSALRETLFMVHWALDTPNENGHDFYNKFGLE